MSNLSELIGGGGGGGNVVDFVASGTLSSGQVVVLRSDGKVEAVDPAGGPAAPGESEIFTFDNAYSVSSAYDPTSNKVVVFWALNGSTPKVAVGTVSGSSISFGTAVLVDNAYSQQMNIGFAGPNTVIVAYTAEGASYTGRVKVGVISGTSISFGGETQYSSANAGYPTFAWDSNSSRIVIFHKGSGDRGTARVGSISGSSVSFGSPVEFQTNGVYGLAATFDSNLNKVVVFYRDGSQWGRAKVGTVSGTSITFGSEATFLSGSARPSGAVFDTSSNKIVLAYIDASNSSYGTAKVCTVSGTSISFGAAVVFKSANTGMVLNGTAAVYDSNANKTVICYGISNVAAILGTVSGTSISFASDTVVSTSGTNAGSCAYDSSANTVVVSYTNSALDGESTLFQAATSTAQNFIGITDAAISNAASGSVTVKFGISSSVTGLTPGTTYYVQDNGTLSTTETPVLAGRALTSTSLLIKG